MTTGKRSFFIASVKSGAYKRPGFQLFPQWRDGMLDQQDMAETAAVAFRDEEGAVRPEFIEQVTAAIERNDAAALKALAGELHEADTGDLIEALDAEIRPRFVELMG